MQRRWMIAIAAGTAATVTVVGLVAAHRRTAETGAAARQGTDTHATATATATATAPGATASARPHAPTGPDSFFTPTRLRPGEKPPQFVIVSFDGAGSHEKWTYWRGVAQRSHMRFTGFLSGVYLLDRAHATAYQGPGHRAGASDVSFSDDPAAVDTLVADLNDAWKLGYEIGTHYNGHFCAGDGYSVGQWSTADWNAELNQFFHFFRDYRTIDQMPTAPTLTVPATSVKGGRTPCLELRRDQLFASLRAHGMTYDSSLDSNGIRWPRKIDGVWEFPLAYVPMTGQRGGVISMDYNFYYKQHQAKDVDAATSTGDSRAVLQTYRNMFTAAYNGNRAPLVLGNHFNSWNHDAYTKALAAFATETCVRPQVRCVPYRDVIRWMQVQDPATLAALQRRPPVLTVG